MSDFEGAIDYFVDPSRTFIGQNSHTAIVCHGTGGNPDQTARQLGDFFRTTPAMTSVHYGIDRAGAICQYVPESAGAGGNGILEAGYDTFWDQFEGDNPNIHTLSFETINDSSNSLPLTDPQKQTVFKLVKHWVDTYDIPLENIKSHASLEPADRARCPGPQFPWQELFDYLNGETTMAIDMSTPGVSSFFEGTGDVWKCKKNNFLVGHGILGFYKKFGGDALCGITYLGLPTSNEIAVLNKAGTTIGVVYQRFERAVVAYDPRHQVDNPPQSGDCYLAHLDNYPGQDPRIADLQKQIAALKQPTPTNLVQINTLSKQIADDVQLILNLSSAQ